MSSPSGLSLTSPKVSVTCEVCGKLSISTRIPTRSWLCHIEDRKYAMESSSDRREGPTYLRYFRQR
ncbi:hypothetical protein C2E23DRAFT_817245 [Lenzites betulinus]|nr:hypothetical protein C2E23DRAFT_817245 [Lenzites betulinus]